MPPKTKRQNRLRVAKGGRVEVVEVVQAVVPAKTTAKNKKKDVVNLDSDDTEQDRAPAVAPPKNKKKSSVKAKDVEESETDEEFGVEDCEIEIDFALGTKVFGYRDLKIGKFQPRSNYSFTVDAYCDGVRFNHPSWQVTVHDRKYTTNVLIPDNLDKIKDINNYISGVLKRPVYADLPNNQFRTYYRKQLVDHIKTKDTNKVIVSYTGFQEDDLMIDDPTSFLCVLGNVVIDQNGFPIVDHKYVFSPEVVQRKVDSKSNIAKLVAVQFDVLSPSSAKDQFAKVLSALPSGASGMPCQLLTAGYLMLLASPVTDKVPEFTKAPLIALVGACSLGKTATNILLLNHFSDKVYMENGTTKPQSLEAKIKTTSLILYGDDFRSQDTESKICNTVYDKIGTTTKAGGSLNDPQASVIYSTNVTDPRIPRVRGRSVFITMKPWMDSLSGAELDQKKKMGNLLTNTKEKALPYLLSLVKRSVSADFISRFADIKNGPFCSQLPIKGDQRLLSFYALLFSWLFELAHEFPAFFDKEASLAWINSTLASELKHYYALDESSKTDFERWLIGFGEELEKMTDYQQLRVSRITTPSKICGGQKCLLINTKRCPVVFGSTIADFKQIVTGMGGETNASQAVLSSSSTDTKLITKGPNKNTDGKRCYMVPLSGLSKACKFSLYSVFGVDESDSDSDASVANEEANLDSARERYEEGYGETANVVSEESAVVETTGITTRTHMMENFEAAKECLSGPSAMTKQIRAKTKPITANTPANEQVLEREEMKVTEEPKKIRKKQEVVPSTRTLRPRKPRL